MLFFTNAKEKTPSVNLSSVVYKSSCPSCSFSYIGKTQRTLHERTEEHKYPNQKSNKQNAIYKHLSTCPHYSLNSGLVNINIHDLGCNKIDINQTRSNTIVLDKADNWNELLFKHPVSVPRWGLLDLPEKKAKFSKLFRGET